LFVFLVQLPLLVFAAEYRLIDSDEGLYLIAGRTLYEGRLLYRDFFWPQVPGVPVLYGAWSSIWGEAWIQARALSVLFTAGAGTILFFIARRRGLRSALTTVAIFATCAVTLTWQPLVKSYAVTTFFLMAAWAALPERFDTRRAGLAGLFFGLAVSCRSLIAPLVLVFLVQVYLSATKRRDRLVGAAWYAFGVVLGLLPIWIFMAGDAEAFFYDNIGSHGDRTASGGYFGLLTQKVAMFSRLLGLSGVFFGKRMSWYPYQSIQTALLFGASFIALGRVLWLRRIPPFHYWMAAVIFAVSMVPTPTYFQYHVVVIPVLAYIVAGLLQELWDRRAVRIAAAVLAVVFVAATPPELHRFAKTGVGVPVLGKEEPPGNWSLATMRRIAAKLDELTRPGEEVISLWPGHLVGSHAAVVPGYENQHTFTKGLKRSDEERARYHMPLIQDQAKLIMAHHTRLIVVGNHVQKTDTKQFLFAEGYRPVASFSPESDAEIWMSTRHER